MKQIAENRIFTVLSRSHTRGEEIAVLLELSHFPGSGARRWGRKVERRLGRRTEGKAGSRGRELGETRNKKNEQEERAAAT